MPSSSVAFLTAFAREIGDLKYTAEGPPSGTLEVDDDFSGSPTNLSHADL